MFTNLHVNQSADTIQSMRLTNNACIIMAIWLYTEAVPRLLCNK